MEAHKLAFADVLTDINNIKYKIVKLKTSEAKIASYRTIRAPIGRKTLESIKIDKTDKNNSIEINTKLQTVYELILPCEGLSTINTKYYYTDILVSRSNMLFIGRKLSRNWVSFDSLSMSRCVRWEFVRPKDFKWLRGVNSKIEPYCGVRPGMELISADSYSELSVSSCVEYCHSLSNGIVTKYISMDIILEASDEYKKKKAKTAKS